METPRLRPRFRAIVPCHPDIALANFEQRLLQADCQFIGSIRRRHLSLTHRPDLQHTWSPVLNVDAEPLGHHQASDSQMGTLLRGHFGPHPNVWTLFVALYAAFAFSALFMAVLAYAQWMSEQTPWAILALPAAALAIGLLYTLARIGQQQAQAQMQQLQAFFNVLTCAQEIISIKEQQTNTTNPVHLKGACALCQRACEVRSILPKEQTAD